MTAAVRPTREEAIAAAAAIYLDEKIRIETEKAIAAATADHDVLEAVAS